MKRILFLCAVALVAVAMMSTLTMAAPPGHQVVGGVHAIAAAPDMGSFIQERVASDRSSAGVALCLGTVATLFSLRDLPLDNSSFGYIRSLKPDRVIAKFAKLGVFQAAPPGDQLGGAQGSFARLTSELGIDATDKLSVSNTIGSDKEKKIYTAMQQFADGERVAETVDAAPLQHTLMGVLQYNANMLPAGSSSGTQMAQDATQTTYGVAVFTAMIDGIQAQVGQMKGYAVA